MSMTPKDDFVDQLNDLIQLFRGKYITDCVILSVTSLGMALYLIVAAFVYRKIRFSNQLLWLIILNIGLMVICKYKISCQIPKNV